MKLRLHRRGAETAERDAECQLSLRLISVKNAFVVERHAKKQSVSSLCG